MKLRYIFLLLIMLTPFTVLSDNNYEISSYTDLKDYLFQEGHKLSYSLKYRGFDNKTVNVAGEVKSPVKITDNNGMEYIEFTGEKITYAGKNRMEEIRKINVYEKTMKKNGSNFNAILYLYETDISGNNSGKIIRTLKRYLLLGKSLHIFDRTHISTGGKQNISDYGLFLRWFQGEFDNHEQHKNDIENGVSNPHRRIHSIIKKIDIPGFEGHTFYLQQYLDGNPDKIYRQRIFETLWEPHSSTVITRIYKFPENLKNYKNALRNPDMLKELKPSDMKHSSDCNIYWRRNGDKFYGSTKKAGCTFISSETGKKLMVSEKLTISEDEFWILENTVDENGKIVYGREDEIPDKMKKCTYYNGQVAVKNKKTDKYEITRNLRFHDQGKKIPIREQKSGKILYSLLLEEINMGKADKEGLKFSIFKENTDQMLGYIWSDPESEEIGLNLGWIQAELDKSE